MIFKRLILIFRVILQHVKEYCEQAAIHGPQHIVAERLLIFERLVTILVSSWEYEQMDWSGVGLGRAKRNDKVII